jgi:hypothetical protein
LKRIIIIGGVALAVLGGGGAAFAASSGFNAYSATETFSPAAGSSSHPAPVSVSEHWKANGAGSNLNARPITKIVVKQYGVKTNGGDFPTCTASQINNAANAKDWNKVCPKGSLIGGGPVSAELLAQTGTGSPAACRPYLFVYNGGKNKQTFLFAEAPQAPGSQYTCAVAKTGTSCAAYSANVSFANNVGTTTINVPPCASTTASNLTGVYASLHTLDVKYPDQLKEKGHSYMESVACKNGKRPYSTTFTATNFMGQLPATQTTTVNGTASCV